MAEEKVPDAEDFDSKIIEVMSSFPKGVSHKILQESLPSLNAQQLVNNLNRLLSQHKIELLQKGNQLVYKLKVLNSSQRYKGTDREEKVIFEAVENAGNNGISGRDLKVQCNLPQPQINKILKNLEGKKLIKSVNSSSRKKIFMLYDLEPSQAITGGIFYDGQNFETIFVDTLSDHCYGYLLKAKGLAENLPDPISQRNASYKSSKDICNYINDLQISKVKISQKDIESILESLVYDEKLEKSISISHGYSSKNSVSENLYRARKPLIANGGLMMVPCGVCRVSQNCRAGGEISPATCKYMQEWLNF